MPLVRCILPKWEAERDPQKRRVYEGEYSQERIERLNAEFYNIYFLPNGPSFYEKGQTVEGSHIDTFSLVFVDCDLKDGKWPSKEAFIQAAKDFSLPPTFIVDSGNGVHAYWQVSDLDAMSYLRLQRRLMRKFNTDPAVGQIYQLMRLPGTVNTKNEKDFKLCQTVHESDRLYTCGELDSQLPIITHEDEEYCKQHFAKTYRVAGEDVKVADKLPVKFTHLLRNNKEVKSIWIGEVEDRSKADYRLGHILFASGFSRDEAISVLVNSPKAITRAPVHRISYAQNIVDKIWDFEATPNKDDSDLSSTVREILERNEGDTLMGTRFPCYRFFDATVTGMRLGNVVGAVAGVGVGKTALSLNMFMGFNEHNPDYHHFFFPLEQPDKEIASRWRLMCGDKTHLYDKVHIVSNYAKDGSYRNLSLEEIKTYLLEWQKRTGLKIGCVVIDHIGILKKKDRQTENQMIIDTCHQMKAFAIQLNVLLIMQSQAPREKAGTGDLELNKDAAYGTVWFESYCDYLITLWQPLKRCYAEKGCPTIMAYKYCKIRDKDVTKDEMQEDVCYRLFFDPATARVRELTQDEEKAFTFFLNKATNKRKADRKTDVVSYKSAPKGTNGGEDRDSNESKAAS